MKRPFPMLDRAARGVTVTLLAGALAACGSDSKEPCNFNADAEAAGGANTVKYSSHCGDDSGGEIYETLTAAIDSLGGTGGTVLVSSGTYKETLQVPAGVDLIGAGPEETIIEPASGEIGIVVSDGAHSVIEGVTVRNAGKVAVGAIDVGITLRNVVIETTSLVDNAGGHGVQIEGAAEVVVEGSIIENNAGTGILAVGTEAVTIIDPAFSEDPNATDGESIIDPAFSPGTQISGNDGGGIAIIDPAFSEADKISGDVLIEGVDIADNQRFGIALFGANGTIRQTAVRGTVARGGGEGYADGVLVSGKRNDGQTPPDDITVSIADDVVIAGCARAGVAGFAGARVNVLATVGRNERGGVWGAGKGTTVTLGSSAELAENGLVGVGVNGGAMLDAQGGVIRDTQLRKGPGGQKDIADGIVILSGAAATISGVVFDDNARAGVQIDKPKIKGLKPDVTMSGATFLGGEYGVAINKTANLMPPADIFQADNNFTGGVKTPVAVDLELETAGSVCGATDATCNVPTVSASAAAGGSAGGGGGGDEG